uniref:Uncharacterized protein n=1 Tax=Solibacter usitatus (strain Ellin6076) TaxID=234267 RepID=Q025P2_SOLUE
MRRRTLLGWLAFLRVPRAQTATFPGDDRDTLRALASIVLPAELGPSGLDRTTDDFIRWVRGYRPGAEMDHGYGVTRLRIKGPSPAPVYLKQLAALRGRVDEATVEAALREAKVMDLPRTPGASHIAADLMAFYFRGSDANDLCYRAAIGRDQCRSLAGSEERPAPLKRTR